MEASTDPFATGVSDPGDDPFAGADEALEQERLEAEQAADGSGELPVVNADGERISPSPQDEGQATTQVTSSGDAGQPEEAAADPSTGGNPASPSSPETPEDGGSSESADESGAQTPPADPSDAVGASSAEPGAVAGSEVLEDELRDESGKVTHRRYFLFKPIGGGKFEQVSWYANAEGKIVGKGDAGAKRQDSCLVRGKTDALQVGFAALGAPLGGVELVAVTSNYWKVRHVEPAPIQPSRTRIKVS